MTKAKTRNCLLTLAFSIMLLLGMTIAVHADDYSTENFPLGEAVRLTQGDEVQLTNIGHVVMYAPHIIGGGDPIWETEQWGGNGPVKVELDGSLRIHDAKEGATVILRLPEGADCWTITKRNDGGSYICEISYLHIHEDGTAFSPWLDEKKPPENPGNYFLTNDVTLGTAWMVPPLGETSLCLNGHGIKYSGTDGSVIIITSGRTLNLYDCDTDTKHSYSVTDGVAAVDATFNSNHSAFTGGYITGGKGTSIMDGGQPTADIGGGVYVVGTFNMHGGTILGNTVGGENTNNPGYGGGIAIDCIGIFNMYGGIICGNKADYAGGVFTEVVANDSGQFNMHGGTIRENTAIYYGGGVYNTGRFVMSGGEIVNNTVSDKIIYDDVHSTGGGVFMDIGTFELAGPVRITGNTVNDKADNIYFGGAAKAVITGDLTTREGTSGPQIGVSMNLPGVFTSGLKNNLPSGKTASDIFFSDSTDYFVSETADGEAQLVAYTDISNGTCSFDDATYAGKGISPETMTLKLSDTDIRKLKLGTDYEITKFKRGDADMGMSKPKYVGDYTVIVEGIGEYKGEANVGFTIKPAPLTIKAKNQTLVYNGEIQGEGDTAYEDAAQIAEKVTVKGLQGSDELTKIEVDGQGKEVGEYVLRPNDAAVGNATDNYDITYVNGTLKITKMSITPSVSIEGWIYGSAENKPVVTGNAGGGKETFLYKKTDEPDSAYTETVPTDAGEYTVKAKIAETANYKAGEATVDFTISPADMEVTAGDYQGTYDGAEHGITVNAPEGATVEYSSDGGETWTGEKPTFTEAGTHNTDFRVSLANYKEYKGSRQVIILQAPITIKADDKSSKYGETLKKLTCKVSGAYVKGDDLGIKLSTAAKKNKAGTTAIKVSWNNNPNYEAKLVNGKYTVKKENTKPSGPTKAEKKAAKIALDAGVVARSSGKKVTASWGAVKGASSYVIYANYCDQKNCKKLKTVSGKTTSINITKVNGKKFNPKKNLKFYVVAYKTVKGKKVKLATSITAHAPGSKNSKRTNVTGVKVKKASFTLKKGKTAKIKAKLVLQKKGKKPLKHCAKFRYASSNTKVAKVSKNGKITAVGKGKCTIYVYSVSGNAKKIKVTVK